MHDSARAHPGRRGWLSVRLTLLCSVATLGLLLWPAQPLHAQDAGTQLDIPATCLACELRLSPDGSVAAVFENAAMVGDEAPQFARLPIRIVDLDSGKAVSRLVGHTDYATDAAFSPDGWRPAASS